MKTIYYLQTPTLRFETLGYYKIINKHHITFKKLMA